MLRIGFLLVFCFCIAYSEAAKSINSHLKSSDLERLQKVFVDGLKSTDLQTVYFSVINSPVTTDKQTICQRLVELHKESKLNEFEKNFYLVDAFKILQCPTPLAQPIQVSVKAALAKDAATAQELYLNFFSYKALAHPIDEATKLKLVKNIQTILKKDDSLNSLGHVFYVAAELGTHGAVIADWIEGAFAQADEVDGKLLQFEGGLSITALVVNGAFKLTNALKKPAPINEDQAVKFAAYFLSRRSVQLPKGASVLLEALNTIVQDKKLAPVCIQLVGNGQVESGSPVVNVKIVNLLGKAIVPAVSTVTATVVSKPGNTVLITKASLVAKSSDKTVFALDLTSSKPVRGSYAVEVQADQLKQTVNIKVLGKVKVNSLEIGVGETDSTSAVKRQTVAFPSKLSSALSADAQQKVVLRAVLVDESTGKPVPVHQAFIRLENKITQDEIIFVAEQDSTKAYKFDMDVGARSADFGHKSGVYSLELIVGDASLSNSFKWLVADIALKFNQEPKESDNGQSRRPRSEIQHLFREPEKRPARLVSDLFSVLCAAPMLVLFFLWAKLNVNVSNFPISLSALGFHVGFGAILSLFGVFFWKLNMFETIRYLIPLALITFFCGNRLLRSIAARKQPEAK